MNRRNFLVTGLFATLLLWAGVATAQTRAVPIYDNAQPVLKFAAGDLKGRAQETSPMDEIVHGVFLP